MRFCLLCAIILKLSSCTKLPNQELSIEASDKVFENPDPLDSLDLLQILEDANNPRSGFSSETERKLSILKDGNNPRSEVFSETERKLSSRRQRQTLGVIKGGYDQILRRTPDNDVFVFIGSSGGYFYHAIKTKRDSFLVPLSGEPISDSDLLEQAGGDNDFYTERLSLVKKLRKSYQKAFIKPITDHAAMSDKRIVLIAFGMTAKTIDAFQSLLSDECPACKSVFLAMLPDETYYYHLQSNAGSKEFFTPPTTVAVIDYVPLPQICLKIFQYGHFVPLTPNLPMEEWSTSSPTLMTEYESRPEVKALIDQISSIDWNSWSASEY